MYRDIVQFIVQHMYIHTLQYNVCTCIYMYIIVYCTILYCTFTCIIIYCIYCTVLYYVSYVHNSIAIQYSTLYILLWHSQCGLYASFEGGVLIKAKHYSLFASCTCNSKCLLSFLLHPTQLRSYHSANMSFVGVSLHKIVN